MGAIKLPVRAGAHDSIRDANDEWIGEFLERDQAEEAAAAINAYDKLILKNNQLRALLAQARRLLLDDTRPDGRRLGWEINAVLRDDQRGENQ